MFRSARISPSGAYRWQLSRWINTECRAKCCEGFDESKAKPGYICWVCNNPSTADGTSDDPTVRRLWAWTRTIGFGAMVLVNVNAYRATKPSDALYPSEDVAAVNDNWLRTTHANSSMTVCAWGDKANETLVTRAVRAIYPIGPLQALRVTKRGNPQHPLYLPAATMPSNFVPLKWIN